MSITSARAKPLDWNQASLIGTPGHDRLQGGPGDDRLEGLEGQDLLRGLAGNDALYGGLGRDRLWGGSGDDVLVGQPLANSVALRNEANVMRGRLGDDAYYVNGPGDRVIEKADEGVDTVYTSIGFTLPDHVENLVAYYIDLIDRQPLVGNALDNFISGSSSGYDTLLGLGGNDTLDGGTRVGGFLDGGQGDDMLILSEGQAVGGDGADLFVARGRGAMTAPNASIQVSDFDGAEGDRIHIVHATALDAADLFESGQLRFEPESQRLVLDFDPASTGEFSVDQVFVLQGVDLVDPAWVTVGPLL